MTHQGRVHKISGKAEEISKRIIKSIPKDKIVYGIGLRRPLWNQIEFQNTTEEREYLKKIAKRYNSNVSSEDQLIAHGTQDCSSLCQILLDGNLKHNVGIETYGNLDSFGENIQVGGYYDRGWGIFVATPRILQSCKVEEHLIVPLSKLKGILLPSQLIQLVKKEFPEYENLLKNYLEFAYTLNQS